MVALRRVFLVVDVRFEYRIDVASRVFLLADIYPLYILYCFIPRQLLFQYHDAYICFQTAPTLLQHRHWLSLL